MRPHPPVYHDMDLRNIAEHALGVAARLVALRDECERVERLLMPTVERAPEELSGLAAKLALQLSRAACGILNTEALRTASQAITQRPIIAAPPPPRAASEAKQASVLPSFSPPSQPHQKGPIPCNA